MSNDQTEIMTERRRLEAMAARLELKTGDVNQINVDMEAVRKIPEKTAEKHRMLAVTACGDTLTVLTDDPLNFCGIEEVRQITGMNLELLLCERRTLDSAIRYYYAELKARQAASEANRMKNAEAKTAEPEEENKPAPAVDLLDSLIKRAYHSHASDIHVEPFEEKTVVRMRIDGSVVEYVSLRKSIHTSLIARIKVLGDMDIAEKRIPQDGHFRMEIGGQTVNMRISVMPTVFGEKAVIRLLAGETDMDHAETFGMPQEDYEKMKKILRSPNGLIYFTGPTGSGKTTTLYMILKELADRPVNIATIEDPVERNIPRISQSQVNYTAGLTFERGLRALLRQDPDIIMIGETRDRETASISVRAAITGHLVLSTLHTNDALSAIVRLEDMGVEPYLAADSLSGLVAQRLVRKLCPECAVEVDADEEARRFLGTGPVKIKAPVGCVCCHHTGYAGRTAIHEVVCVDRNLRKLISQGADMEEIRRYARETQGMKTLKERGIRLVLDGVTGMEELLRVAYDE